MSRNPVRALIDRAERLIRRPEALSEAQMDELRVEAIAFGVRPGSYVDVLRPSGDEYMPDESVLFLFDHGYFIEIEIADPKLAEKIAGQTTFRIPGQEHYTEYVRLTDSRSHGAWSMPTEQEFAPLLEHMREARTNPKHRIIVNAANRPAHE